MSFSNCDQRFWCSACERFRRPNAICILKWDISDRSWKMICSNRALRCCCFRDMIASVHASTLFALTHGNFQLKHPHNHYTELVLQSWARSSQHGLGLHALQTWHAGVQWPAWSKCKQHMQQSYRCNVDCRESFLTLTVSKTRMLQCLSRFFDSRFRDWAASYRLHSCSLIIWLRRLLERSVARGVYLICS